MIVLPWIITALAITAFLTIYRIEGFVMSEVQDAVDAITAQVVKAREEVLAEIAALEAQVANGVAPDFTALKAAVQSVDDIVADPAPVEPAPVEDAPVDPAPPTE